MGTYLAKMGARSDALRYFAETVRQAPQFALAAAALAQEQGDQQRTVQFAEAARVYYEQKLAEKPSDVQARLELARALILLQQEDVAAKLLNDGAQMTNDPQLAMAIGGALVAWSNRLGNADKSPQTLIKRLQILRGAVQRSPSNPVVSEAIIQLALECRENANEEAGALRTALINGLDPQMVHFIQGTALLQDGKYDDAKKELELAASDSINFPGLMNNLAVAIAAKPDANLEQALAFANIALEKLPSHPYLLETRGQIYAKMERWPEAIRDLEPALTAVELRPQIYPSLATAYRGIGDSKRADDYQKLGEKK